MLRTLSLVAALALPGVATAQNIIAGDGTRIANYFLNEGFAPELTTDSVGDPLINVDFYGTDMSVYFYGCDEGARCSSIQFYSGYSVNGAVRLAQINEWNTENRYAKAYISESGSARIEYDIYLGNTGLTEADFAKALSSWVQLQKQFEAVIDW